MLEPSSVTAYKSIFQIVPTIPNSSDFLDTLYMIIYRDISAQTGILPDYQRFRNGMQYKSEDETLMLRTVFLRSEEPKISPFQWALFLRSRDQLVRRRTWFLHIGFSWQSDASVSFNLALQYSDHLAGSMSILMPPAIQPPVLVQKLLTHPALTCLSGASPIPASPIHLMVEDFPDILHRIFDPTRTFPIVLITCPDLINPSALYAKSQGNLIIFWLDDYLSYEHLYESLLPEMQFPWGAVKIFIPMASKQPYHPTFTIEDITRMGHEAVLEGIRRSFCVCPTGAERRAFVTLNGLYSLYKEQTTMRLRAENERLLKECQHFKQTAKSLTESQARLSAELEACKTQVSKMQDASWEELLNESLLENERLKKGLSQIISGLFDNLNSPLLSDELDACPELHELAVAIRTFRNLLISRPR